VTSQIEKPDSSAAWELASRQHGVVAARQLATLGLGRRAIQHRVDRGRLYPVMRGVYAVGRPELTRHGWWMAAVLACGASAVLSHRSAAALWGILRESDGSIEISHETIQRCRRPGIRAHRRTKLGPDDLAVCAGIPVTAPVRTLVDLAAMVAPARLERAITEADRLDLVDPIRLRGALASLSGQRGVGRLRALLDRRTFRLTDSELESRFLALVLKAGLPLPRTRQMLNGFRVDFFWPELGLVVETDGLRYHRTPAQQAKDRIRDQAHVAAGHTSLRFTHSQVRFEPVHVCETLTSVVARLEARGSP
jgi:very-short-patch-repair endonuclease